MSWLFSRALVEASLGGSSSDGEPSAASNLMPTPRPFSCSDKTMEFSPPSPFGVTLQLLTADRGEAVLTSYLAAFPVRTSAPRAAVPASKVSDPACGWKWPGSLAKYDPASRSWKTRQSSLLGGLAEFSETWPTWGSMRDGECLALTTPAHITSETESGSWQTPVADDSVNRKRGKVNSRGELKLSAQVKRWPTPHGFSKDGRSNGPSGNELGRAVNRSMWPTPKASAAGPDFAKLSRSKTGISLQTAVALWPTPAASDNRDRGNLSTPAIQRRMKKGKQVMLSMCVSDESGSLNPPWVEWLMGWPIEWTALKPLETDKFQAWLHWHGEP